MKKNFNGIPTLREFRPVGGRRRRRLRLQGTQTLLLRGTFMASYREG